jgi:hypothetical protein
MMTSFVNRCFQFEVQTEAVPEGGSIEWAARERPSRRISLKSLVMTRHGYIANA